MKIPKYIKGKMHRFAKMNSDANRIAMELTLFFDEKGFDTDDLWEGKGLCLAELEQGNDITEELCSFIEMDFISIK